MGKPKDSKIKKKEKHKDGTFTKHGFVKRLVHNGWTLKDAVREYNNIMKGVYDE